jgi:hypothetical protein
MYGWMGVKPGLRNCIVQFKNGKIFPDKLNSFEVSSRAIRP